MVFTLLGRAPKCPKVASVVLRETTEWRGAEFASVRTAPLVAMLYIRVQGKILFVVRALLLENIRKPLT